MDTVAQTAVNARQYRAQSDDDFADRLSSRYTVVQLVVFAVFVSHMQFISTPMTCWSPVHFTAAHDKFADNYCWVKNTYYLPWDNRIPKEWESDKRQMIPYYQWIPFILILQAVLFYIPSVVWHGLNHKAGVDTDSIMTSAVSLSTVDTTETSEWVSRLVVNQIDRFLSARQKQADGCRKKDFKKGADCSTRRMGCYLSILFLVSKLLYIANAIGQLFLLSSVLATKYNTFGADIVKNMIDNVDWSEESYVAFPRVTLCDFKVRGQDMDNVHRYTVQCVLPINLYNEKIYIYLWFWMIFVAAISLLSFIVWCVRSLIPLDRIRFVRRHVSERLDEIFIDSDKERKKSVLRTFTEDYLQSDGVLLLRLIAHNTDAISTTEVATGLLEVWVENIYRPGIASALRD